MTMNELLTAYFEEKQLPLVVTPTSEGNTAYAGRFKLSSGRELDFMIVLQAAAPHADFHIIYKELAFAQFEKRVAYLEKINELNVGASGYYKVILAKDGEIYMQATGLASQEDISTIYDVFAIGSGIVQTVMESLSEV